MRVLILGDAGTRDRTGGAYSWNLGLLRALREAGHDARCLSPIRRGDAGERHTEDGLRYVEVPVSRRPPVMDDYRYALATGARLAWEVLRDRWKPDVLHLDGPRPELYALAGRLPLVTTFHGCCAASAGAGGGYQRLGAAWMRILARIERASLRAAQPPLFNSLRTRLALASAHGEAAAAHGVVSWLGIPEPFFGTPPEPSGPFRDRHGGAPLVVSVGNITRGKRLDLVVELARRTALRHPGARFVIVGRDEDPACADELRRAVSAGGLDNRVRFAGQVSACGMPQVYAGADLVFHPSAGETFCLAVAEAMAAGRPVVARAGLAMDDYLDNGVHGFLARTDEALLEGASRLLEDAGRRRALGAAAQRRARDLFSWPAVVARMESAYAMAQHRHRRVPMPAGVFPSPAWGQGSRRAPDFSVVVPTWNEARDLAPCLEALSRQTLAPREVLVVDGGSTDGTAELAESWAGRLPLTVIREGQRRGVAAARNTGLARARGDRLLILNADVYLPEDFLARVAAHHAAGADAVVATSPVINRGALLPDYLGAWAWQAYRDTPAWWSEGYSVRTALARDAGGFRPFPAASAGEDLDFGRRVAAAGLRVEDRTLEAPNRIDEDWSSFWRLRRERGKGAAVYARMIQGRDGWLDLARSLVPAALVLALPPLALPGAWGPMGSAGLAAAGFLAKGLRLTRYARHRRPLRFAAVAAVHWLAHKTGWVQGCLVHLPAGAPARPADAHHPAKDAP